MSLKCDFNLIDAFRILDPNGKGSVSSGDIGKGLQFLSINSTQSELNAFLKRFDKDGDRLLRYSEFCEAFLPVDNFHASLLAKKAPQIGVQGVIFCPATMDQYRDVWAYHLRNEMLVEKTRSDNGIHIMMQQAFEALDANRDGYIDREDVSLFCY